MKQSNEFNPMDFSILHLEKATGYQHLWDGDKSLGWEFYTKENPYVTFAVDEEAKGFIVTVRTSDEGNPVYVELKDFNTAISVYAFTFASWMQLRNELRKTFAF